MSAEDGLFVKRDFMTISELNLESAMWISPELEDAVVPRRDPGRSFTSVTANDVDFVTCSDFGRHAGYLRKRFFCTPDVDSTLYVSAHGLYEIYINNKKITDAVLSPGPCNSYMKQPLDSYDVTPFLKAGENEITVALGNGWYRGSCGPDGQKVLFGKDLSLYLQLIAGGRQVLCSDTSWDASTDGPIRGNDLEQGEIYIAGKEPQYLRKAREVRLTKELFYLSDGKKICRHETFPGKFLTTPDGSTVIDFGQNMAGVVDISLKGAPAGGHLALVCGETLDAGGNFTIQNFQPGRRHFEGGIRQEERVVTAEGDCDYRPSFTIFGFRYAKVVADFPVTPENAVFTAAAIYSDMEETAEFTCSDADVNRLFQNCIWSQKSCFCGIPATAPTCGRSGETGQAAFFAHTGLRLMDSCDVWYKWLTECEAAQHKNGRIPAVCPPVRGVTPGLYRCSQSTGWGDACIIVPWEMYEYTGDAAVLKRFYPMMQKWFEFLVKRAGKRPLKNPYRMKTGRRNRLEKYTIDKGFDFGEGREPGFEDEEPQGNAFMDVGTAYFAYDGLLLGRIAQLLAESLPEKNADYKRLINESLRYTDIGEKARDAYITVFTRDGLVSSRRQSLFVRPLAFGLLPEDKRQTAAESLQNNIKMAGFHLNTGFLTTPYLPGVLAEYGCAETAYHLLLNATAPGWLYEVKHGATSVWKDWDGIDADGNPAGALNSLSGAAIASFLLEDVGGIHYTHGHLVLKPLVAPVIPEGKAEEGPDSPAAAAVLGGARDAGSGRHFLENASVALDSPEGRITCGWKYEADGSVTVSGSIPEGLSAELVLPDGRRFSDVTGEFSYTCE